ncbi:hypothetical protein CAAN1_11S04192 [[Candida] anglica]|uniref:Protein BFR2 n=1 Tax=[Candida] anglica TaxID=148631 RepID=A0ABP0ELE0_9ASCO
MAFNSAYQLRHIRTNTSLQNDTSSVVERANSLLSDSQSSWVLFSPSMETTSAVNVGSDILSFTNGSFEEEDDAEQDDVEEEEVDEVRDYNGYDSGEVTEAESDLEDDDSLIDNLKQSNLTPSPSQSRLEQLILNYGATQGGDDSLNKRINKWKMSQDVPVDDNTASWDLDENIIHDLLQAKELDTSILSGDSSSYYGNDIFKGYSRGDLMRFRRIANDLKSSLNRKEDSTKSFPLAITQLLMRLFEKEQHNQQYKRTTTPSSPNLKRSNNSHKRYSTILSEFIDSKESNRFLSSVIKNQIKNSLSSHSGEFAAPQYDTISSTGSSSLVACGGGGGGFGGSSWNDI